MDEIQLVESYVKSNDMQSIINFLSYDETKVNIKDIIKIAIDNEKFNITKELFNFVDKDIIYDLINNIKSNYIIKLLDVYIKEIGYNIDYNLLFENIINSNNIKNIKSILLYINDNNIKLNWIYRGDIFLIKALETGNLKIIKFIYKKCFINRVIMKKIDIFGEDAVISSINSDSYECVKWLDYVLKNINYKITQIILPKKCLKICCENNKVNSCKYILDNWMQYIDIHEKGELFFRLACENGSLDISKILYEYCNNNNDPIDIYSFDNYAFEKACWNNHYETVKWLDSIGCKLNIKKGNHKIFDITFKKNNNDVINWMIKKYPIYKIVDNGSLRTSSHDLENDNDCTCTRCKNFYRRYDNKGYKIDELNFLKVLFNESRHDEIKDFLTMRGIIKIKNDKEQPRECLICAEEYENFINVGCKYYDHIYCINCLIKNFNISLKKECLICKKTFKDQDLRMVIVEE